MAHFAELNNDNTVIRVIVISNGDCDGGEFPASEAVGQAFIANTLKLGGTWKQTSYNKNFRGVYAGIGFTYDADADLFVEPVSEVVE